jgi:lipoprotein-releasing system ATP-binding protein
MNNAGENLAQNGKPLLEARDVHKIYTIGKRKLEVLRGVTLSMNPGEFLALRGASGAGKSTLLHLLGGLDLPNRGEVFFAQQNLKQLSNTALTRLRNTRVGFVFQAYHLLPELSALENVCLPARMARKSVSETKARAVELLKRVGLGERMEHRPYELSGGEQQRVALARALINKPDLLLADEPTGNLDSHTGDEILDLICSLREEQNMTLVIATHSARLAARAPKVIELLDGEIESN